jgi:hypothetical protein
MGTGVRHIDRYKTEMCLLVTGTATGASLWLDMGDYSHVTFFFLTSNSSGTPAATFTVNQALTSGGSSSKSLGFNNYFYCSGGFSAQSSSGDIWLQSTGVSGSIAATSTVSTIFGYAVEVHDTDLDLTNAFRFIAASVASTASISVALWAHCFPRFDGNFASMPTALT